MKREEDRAGENDNGEACDRDVSSIRADQSGLHGEQHKNEGAKEESGATRHGGSALVGKGASQKKDGPAAQEDSKQADLARLGHHRRLDPTVGADDGERILPEAEIK